MAFNADEYIGVIVEQIGGNFQELHEAVGNCEELQKAQKKYLEFDMDNGDVEKFVELHDKYSLQKKSIGNLVCNYDVYKTIEPLSVGLFGEWGSGKTHLLKLIEQQVINLQHEKKVFPQTTIPVFFNAWRFEKEEHLIVPLFQTLLASIENFDSKHLPENIQKQLGRTKERLKILSFALAKGFQIPKDITTTVATLLTGDLTVIADFIDTDKVAKAFKEGEEKAFVTEKSLTELLKSDRIESIYMNIPQWIEKITIADKINFVFLIDDLDRCLPENTLKMLESIKLFLDVPSCAFVLAIDDDVVERGVAYHYRDYLKDVVRMDGQNKKESQELPITGHEYLEKMIQLPFRIPVLGTDNIYEFLYNNYKETFENLLNNENENKTDEILEFFSKTIPPKPRKLKRVAKLFETKIRLLNSLGFNEKVKNQPKLIARITLLELFAPKLLRFIQNNGYERIYNRLVHFGNLIKVEPISREKIIFSLVDTDEIKIYIERVNFTSKEKELFLRLMNIIQEMKNSRIIFNLDAIFDKVETEDDLKLNIEMSNFILRDKEQKLLKYTSLVTTSIDKLFRIDDAVSWSDAFKDNKLLASGEAFLSNDELSEVIEKAKLRKEFAQNPEWVGMVAKYINDEQYILLLKELYSYRFLNINKGLNIYKTYKWLSEDNKMDLKDLKYQWNWFLRNHEFEIAKYQVTFSEYDRYCQFEEKDKPNDNEWGRGNRPIINISWEDATAYAEWLSHKLEKIYKLPTEKEWHLACNNGKNSKWYFGNDGKELKEYAWYSENSEGVTHPIGEKKANKLGLYDMHGNVWEFCENCYDDILREKIICGASYKDNINITYSSNIDSVLSDKKSSNIGFRLLRTLP